MRSIHDIVQKINEAIPVDSRDTYGIVTMSRRGDQIIPSIDGKYIGIDDTYPMRVYHKINGMTSQLRAGSGYGDSVGDQVNTYQMSMIVFNDKKRTKLSSDQMVLMLQVNTPRRVASELFKSIRITYTNAILNDVQVFAQEYGSTDYRLKDGQSLIQINYTVEATYKEGCFAKCPEDFCNN